MTCYVFIFWVPISWISSKIIVFSNLVHQIRENPSNYIRKLQNLILPPPLYRRIIRQTDLRNRFIVEIPGVSCNLIFFTNFIYIYILYKNILFLHLFSIVFCFQLDCQDHLLYLLSNVFNFFKTIVTKVAEYFLFCNLVTRKEKYFFFCYWLQISHIDGRKFYLIFSYTNVRIQLPDSVFQEEKRFSLVWRCIEERWDTKEEWWALI